MTPRKKEPEGAVAAVLGGAVTRERLFDSATRAGLGGSPLLRSLLAQSLPSIADLAAAYKPLRLDASFLAASARGARVIDPDLLRRERCLPVEVLDDLCVLAVEEGRARSAVRAVRAALQRDVLPVIADSGAIEQALDGLEGPQRAVRHGSVRHRDAPVHSRFRSLVLEDTVLGALPLEAEGP